MQAIMGAKSGSSVMNTHLQHWEFSNLFVVGSSAFSPQGGDNPTPTILALAYGTADPIVSRYSKSPGIVN
jgi:gluconate 2-dehydrogenase alpha chain